MTMAMVAAPQPFFSCFTNGTSSHMPSRSAASRTPRSNSIRTAALRMMRGIRKFLVHRDDDKDESSDTHQDNQQIVVVHPSSGEVSLRILRAGCKLREFVIT